MMPSSHPDRAATCPSCGGKRGQNIIDVPGEGGLRAMTRCRDPFHSPHPDRAGDGQDPTHTAPMAMDEEGNVRVICEACGSTSLDFDGWDIDKCRDCGHWRYRGREDADAAK